MSGVNRKSGLAPIRPPFEWRLLAPGLWPTWLLLGFIWGLAYLPWVRRWLARRLGALVYSRNRKRREIVEVNLAWCFPEKSEAEREQIARDYFRYYVQVILDTGLFWWAGEKRFRRNIVLEGDEALARDLAAGEKVIIVTCHTLPLDRGGVALSADYPFQTFVNRARNPVIDWVSARRRARFDGLVFPRDGGLRPVIKALKHGHPLYILTDEDLGPEASVYAPFFGIPRATLTTPGRIARMTGAKVHTSITYYDEARRQYIVRLWSEQQEFPSGDELADATRLNGVIEEMIRTVPEQYMWSLRLFQTFPDGSPPPYTMKGKPGSGPRPRPEGTTQD